MAYLVSRVIAHETVLNWHEQNVERDRKARAIVKEMDNEHAVTEHAGIDSDSEQDR